MSYRLPSVTINGDTRNVFNKPLIAAYSFLLATGDAVVETHEDLTGVVPGSADYEGRHRAARIAHEEARMHDHAAQVLMAETIRIEWLETGEKPLGECLQACEGFHVDEAILRRVVARQDAVKAFMARLNAPLTVPDPTPVPVGDDYTGYLISPDQDGTNFYAGTEDEALDAYARDGGYRDFAHLASTQGKSVDEALRGLIIYAA